MKHLKNILIILPTTLLLTCMPVVGLAHPGRLDKKGGHKNKKTGTYHYHDANGNEVSEKSSSTKKNSSSSSKNKSSNTSSSSISTTYITTENTTLYAEADKESKSLLSIPADTTVTAIEKTQYFIKTKVDGSTGYIRLKHLKAK